MVWCVEKETITVPASNTSLNPFAGHVYFIPVSPNTRYKLIVLGAVWGGGGTASSSGVSVKMGDVTPILNGFVSALNDNGLRCQVSNNTFGDTWHNTAKTLTVLYTHCPNDDYRNTGSSEYGYNLKILYEYGDNGSNPDLYIANFALPS